MTYKFRLPAEWEPQDAVLLSWPHAQTDWAPILNEVEECYMRIARAIAADEPLIVVTPQPEHVRELLTDIPQEKLLLVKAMTNDTWIRDYGPITLVAQDGDSTHLDFTFNGWGMKFAANYDNQVCRALAAQGLLDGRVVNMQDMVLEGGSIESDGNGTIMTTRSCLLSPNRNDFMSPDEIEEALKEKLQIKKVLWVSEGYVPGDDTDGHIDTLARFAPDNVILHATARPEDSHFESLESMRAQLAEMTDAQGKQFRLMPLPAPEPIFDEDGTLLPATYANFLVTNQSVLVPTYNQEGNDKKALAVLEQSFEGRKIVGIDCTALIKQHGSLHCATMQIPKGSIK